MPWSQTDYITQEDLGFAYRKAKVDLYYERGHPNAFALCDFEAQLGTNLQRLYEQLHSGSLEWMTDSSFVGDWSAIPKPGLKDQDSDSLRHIEANPWKPIDPDEAWAARLATSPTRTLGMRYRLVGKHSIAFHVISALWLLKVGHKYDALLGDGAYGSRIRRPVRRPEQADLRPPNRYASGSFEPWHHLYGRWLNGGLDAMRAALHANKRIVAITADVQRFYHSVSPDFLLDRTYLTRFSLLNQFDKDDTAFTQALISALHTWARRTPLHGDGGQIGVPVGLSAARLIANVALAELDETIRRNINPLYYGRYVDDIILVLEDTRRFVDAESVWRFIADHTDNLLRLESSDVASPCVLFQPSYLSRSRIAFAGDKQRIFPLVGPTGLRLVQTIEHQIRERSSEWRSPPDLPESPEAMAPHVVAACDVDGEEVVTLRQLDSLAARRAVLAMRLRDLEALQPVLQPDDWAKQREVFFDVARGHFLSATHLPEFIDYAPRMLSLAVACADFAEAQRLVVRIAESMERIRADCRHSLFGGDYIDTNQGRHLFPRASRHLMNMLLEAFAGALTELDQNGLQARALNDILRHLSRLNRHGQSTVMSVADLLKRAQLLERCDFARRPFRAEYLPFYRPQMSRNTTTGPKTPSCADEDLVPFLNYEILTGVRRFRALMTGAATDDDDAPPVALLFPTRPFTLSELYIAIPSLLEPNHADDVRAVVLAFRGFSPWATLPTDDSNAVIVPFTRPEGPVRIAVTSWKTEERSVGAGLLQMNEPDATRYFRLQRLITRVLRSSRVPHYIILPELAVPWHWFYRFAHQCSLRQASLIAGVDYIRTGQQRVRNQAWISLATDFLGFQSFIVHTIDKQEAAACERRYLDAHRHHSLAPPTTPRPHPIQHGAFRFGVLVCSDFSNIELRRVFRGAVDALFITEWNQDVESFSALVEASALDLHAYIVQCNDRQFGDSRIRAPMRNSWERDIVRVKGGVDDYHVIGEIDVAGLRRHQTAPPVDPKTATFKTVPSGFRPHPSRELI